MADGGWRMADGGGSRRRWAAGAMLTPPGDALVSQADVNGGVGMLVAQSHVKHAHPRR